MKFHINPNIEKTDHETSGHSCTSFCECVLVYGPRYPPQQHECYLDEIMMRTTTKQSKTLKIKKTNKQKNLPA